MMRPIILFFLLLQFQTIFSQLNVATYSIKNIKANTKYSDFGTSYFGPNRIIFASSKLDHKNLRNNSRNDNDIPKYDLFKGYLNLNGDINYAKKILNNFSTKYNESNVSFTPDLKHVYFTQNNIKKGKYIENDKNWINLKIYRADVKTNGQWTNIVALPFNNDDYSCAHPTVSEDGRILFFTSDMPGTYGQSDIYWVTISEKGTYGVPQNLGPLVNTKAKETFPYVDGNILYFSSDRPESVGGLDIFQVALDEPDSKPINLGNTLNSRYDDFCFIIDRNQKTGFFSSNRPEGKGEDDIYFFRQDFDLLKCRQIVKGEIRDSETNRIIPKATISIFTHDNILISTFLIKSDGKYNFDLACRGNYKIQVNKTGYKEKHKNIGFVPNKYSQDINLYLEKIYIDKPELIVEEFHKPKIIVDTSTKKIAKQKETKTKPVVKKTPIIIRDGKEMLDLKPIYFELDEYYITQESYETLSKVARIIDDYPNIVIEFGSHTDCRASDSYNLHLSTLRAQEVVKHLVHLGVPEYRIKGRGYGESKLINKCKDGVDCSEKEHTQNRRAEFVIIRK